MLRRFLYLDIDTVFDYLSALQGGVFDSDIEETQRGKVEKGGELGINKLLSVQGRATSETSTETKGKRIVGDAAQFQTLYELIDAHEDIRGVKYLEAFSDEFWSDDLDRDDVLEIQAQIAVPEFLMVLDAANNLSPLLNLMTAVDPNFSSDENIKNINLVQNVAQLSAEEPVPIVFHAVSSPKFKFAAHLSRKYLRCDLKELEGEAKVFGKVIRKLPKGTSEPIFDFIPSLTQILGFANRQQRRKMEKEMRAKGLQEAISGPAILLHPIAVYR